jgi:aryl-alcohol dehydrogenase-like predicted oxidoreductase
MNTNFHRRIILGRTGIEVSRLGIASGYGIDAPAIEKAFHESGINYFYWSTPRKKGMEIALKNLVPSHRDKIAIVFQSYDHSGWYMPRGVENGLRDINSDYADVLLLGFYPSMPSKRVLENAQKLKDSGKIRFIALSGHNRKLFGKLAQDPNSPIDIFMARYNAAHTGAEQDIFPFLNGKQRPGVTIYTATCWGKLLNPAKMPANESPLTASDCYRFVLSNPNVELCMMGPKNAAELADGLKALERGPLTDSEMERVRRIGKFVCGR